MAILHSKIYRIERNVTKGCPQGSCCGPGFWNVLYNDLLNMKYSSHTTLITFADDLIILTYGKTISEAEAHANSDLAKIEKWTWTNEMKFNDSKSKAMLIARKRRLDEIQIYLNNKRLEQVNVMKYLGIHFDSMFRSTNTLKNNRQGKGINVTPTPELLLLFAFNFFYECVCIFCSTRFLVFRYLVPTELHW